MEERQEAECVAGRGIVGDRYYAGTGTYSPKPDVREVTLIEQEALDALSRNDPPVAGRADYARATRSPEKPDGGRRAAQSPGWTPVSGSETSF
jgi:hypothetical protein